jgi:hypothetical protein
MRSTTPEIKATRIRSKAANDLCRMLVVECGWSGDPDEEWLRSTRMGALLKARTSSAARTNLWCGGIRA